MTVDEWIATLSSGDQTYANALKADTGLTGSETFLDGWITGTKGYIKAQPANIVPPPIEVSNDRCDLL